MYQDYKTVEEMRKEVLAVLKCYDHVSSKKDDLESDMMCINNLDLKAVKVIMKILNADYVHTKENNSIKLIGIPHSNYGIEPGCDSKMLGDTTTTLFIDLQDILLAYNLEIYNKKNYVRSVFEEESDEDYIKEKVRTEHKYEYCEDRYV